MHVVHLTASTFFGGPERQMLGLAQHLPVGYRTSFVGFSEGGRCRTFLKEVQASDFPGVELRNDTRRAWAAVGELADWLTAHAADVVLAHGYKPNILGRPAGRRAGVPVVAVSRGWTWENPKVRLYEAADRFHLRFMDRVVAVSDGQAKKVRRTGVGCRKLSVIRNAARLAAFAAPDPDYRRRLRALLPGDSAVSRIVIGAGRLSPEKGFAVLVEAAASVPDAGFVLFGEGAERPALERQVRELGLADRVVLPGFTAELDRFLPWADLLVLPSFTEGLPNVALEASAAGLPVVATRVGGTPEVVADGETGLLVRPGDPAGLAAAMHRVLADEAYRQRLGSAGRRRMHERFTFEAQAAAYVKLFAELRRAA